MKAPLSQHLTLISIALSLLISSCGAGSKKESFKLLTSYKIDVPEPSGLSFGADNSVLYTVSDRTNEIYKLSLKGEILANIPTEAKDLEGISYCRTDNTIWLADERERKLLKVNLEGKTLKSVNLNLTESTKKNSGIEGLTIDYKTGNMFCLNEKKPGLLIKTDNNGTVLEKNKLDFAGDYSGVYHDAKTNELWIISDKSMTITRFDSQGNLMHTFQTDVKSMEGIVVNSQDKIIYIVSDELERLFVFAYN